MPKRSITDEEISLIRAMLARKMKNRDIQFYFNRQDRPVNSGRITQIRDGSYGPNVAASTDAELAAFLSLFKPSAVGVAVPEATPSTPLSRTDLARALFAKLPDGRWKLHDGETDQHECKQEFDAKNIFGLLRAIAALSNNRGGYVFLGVSNADCIATGINGDFDGFDIARLIDKAKTHLAPTPRITAKGSFVLDGLTVGFIHVDLHPDRPVIVCRDGGGKGELCEGDILFRYAGQSARIKFADLRSMLEERDRRARMALAEAAGKIATIGTAKALILDTDKNVLAADGREILIDEELAKQINFIREGQFDEVNGAPALKLMGEVKPVNVIQEAQAKLVPKAISQEDILSAFLDQNAVAEPLEYIRAAVSQPRKWLPLHYFANLSGKTTAEIIAELTKLETSQHNKKANVIARLEGKQPAFTKTVTQKAASHVKEFQDGVIKTPSAAVDVSCFCQGIAGSKTTKASLQDAIAALAQCREMALAAQDMNALGTVFKAACRVDEMFFAAAK
ncbi:MAG: ATP-binding protein [Bosea sp.]|nr:ATP-binding protein [Bosea sp. (in: a-proteobacteria)]